MLKRSITILVFCLITLATATALRAQSVYDVQLLPDGAFALNDVGQVALRTSQGRDGGGNPYYSIQIWQDGSTTTLGTALAANGYHINNSGQVAGTYTDDAWQEVACVWSASGRADIVSGETASAMSINDAGYVVGTYGADYQTRRGFVWDGTTVTDLTAPGAVDSEAYDINSSNQVTGTVTRHVEPEDGYDPYDRAYPVLWNGSDALFLNEQGFDASCGLINNAGQIMGYHYNDFGSAVSVLWTNGKMAYTTGPEGDGFGYGLNDAGQIVGVSHSGAFLWQDGSMIDLNSALPTGSPYYFEVGCDINKSGQILVSGWYSTPEDAMGPIPCSFLLTPVPEPSCLLILGCGLAALVRSTVRRRTSL